MSLRAKLEALPPAERDIYLSSLWRGFTDSACYEALQIMLSDLLQEGETNLLSPFTKPNVRAHAAGQVAAVRRLLRTIEAAVNFDPATAVYDEPVQPEDNFPDPFQIV